MLLHRHRKLSPVGLRWRVGIEYLGSTLIAHNTGSDAVVVDTDVDIDTAGIAIVVVIIVIIVLIVGGIVIVVVIVIN